MNHDQIRLVEPTVGGCPDMHAGVVVQIDRTFNQVAGERKIEGEDRVDDGYAYRNAPKFVEGREEALPDGGGERGVEREEAVETPAERFHWTARKGRWEY